MSADTVLITDDYDVSTDTNISVHTTDQGDNYIEIAGLYNNGHQLVVRSAQDKALFEDNGSTQDQSWYVDTAALNRPNTFIEAVFNSTSWESDSEFGVELRADPEGGGRTVRGYYDALSGTDRFVLEKEIGGVVTELAQYSMNIVKDTDYTMRLEVIDTPTTNEILGILYLDNKPIIAQKFTESGLYGKTGKPGIFVQRTSSWSASDNIKVDNLSAGLLNIDIPEFIDGYTGETVKTDLSAHNMLYPTADNMEQADVSPMDLDNTLEAAVAEDTGFVSHFFYHVSDALSVLSESSQYAEAIVESTNVAVGNMQVGVVCRYQGASNDKAIVAVLDGHLNAVSREVVLLKRIGLNNYQNEGDVLFSSLANNTRYKLRLEVRDLETANNIECKVFVDDVLVLTNTIVDSDLYGNAGRCGIRAQSDSNWSASDEVRFHRFEAGIFGSEDREFAGIAVGTFSGTAKMLADLEFGGTAVGTFGGMATINTNLEFGGTAVGAFGGMAKIVATNFSFVWGTEYEEFKEDYEDPRIFLEVDSRFMPNGAFPIGQGVDKRIQLPLPRLTENDFDVNVGLTGFKALQALISNDDGFLNLLNLNGAFVRGSYIADGIRYKTFYSQVTRWDLSNQCPITLEDIEIKALTEPLLKRRITEEFFTNDLPANDLGQPVPILFGRFIKSRALYVNADEAARQYDYIVGEGKGLNDNNFSSITTVYRKDAALDDIEGTASGAGSASITLETADRKANDWYNFFWVEITGGQGVGQIKHITDYDSSSNVATVDSSWSVTPNGTSTYRLREWRFYNGSQTDAGDYPGFAFIRFKKRQGGRGSTDPIYVSGNALQDERNWVRCIQSILSNSVWGLGLIVDTSNFDTSAALSEVTTMLAEGGVTNPNDISIDVIKKLLRFRGGTLTRGQDGIGIAVDQVKTSSGIFTHGGGDGNPNIITNTPTVSFIGTDVIIKDMKVQYRKNLKEANTYQFNLERTANTQGIAKTLPLDFIYDHDTADRWLDYNRKREMQNSKQLTLDLGQDAKALQRGDAITLNIPYLTISQELWEVKNATTVTAGSQRVIVIPYSTDPYTYEAFVPLPTDKQFDPITDYENTDPDPISNLSVSMLMDTRGRQSYPYSLLTWTPPEDNYSNARVLTKLNSEAESLYRDKGAHKNNARIDGLTPGQLYDFRVIALGLNPENESIAVENLSNLAGGDNATTNPPSGIVPGSKFGYLFWTFNPSPDSDILYYEYRIWSASFGGTLLKHDTIAAGDKLYADYQRVTGSLLSPNTAWFEVRAVDYSGNPSSYTSRVSAQTDQILQDDIVNSEITGLWETFQSGQTFSGTIISLTATNMRGFEVDVDVTWLLNNRAGLIVTVYRDGSVPIYPTSGNTVKEPGFFHVKVVDNPTPGNHTYSCVVGNNGGISNRGLSVQERRR